MIEDVIEELLALIDVVLDSLEDSLLLLKLSVQLLLSLIVEVKLANRGLLQLVQLTQGVNLMLSRLRHLLCLVLLLIVVVG